MNSEILMQIIDTINDIRESNDNIEAALKKKLPEKIKRIEKLQEDEKNDQELINQEEIQVYELKVAQKNREIIDLQRKVSQQDQKKDRTNPQGGISAATLEQKSKEIGLLQGRLAEQISKENLSLHKTVENQREEIVQLKRDLKEVTHKKEVLNKHIGQKNTENSNLRTEINAKEREIRLLGSS